MRMLRVWWHRLAGLFGRRGDRELDAELDAHLQLHIDDNRRRGLSAIDARRQALISLGSRETVMEQHRERRTVPIVENALRDVRHVLRSLRRSPVFTVVTAATLALGIGGITAIFAVVDAVLLRPLPFRDAGRLVMIWERSPKSERRNVSSMLSYSAWRERSHSFEAMSAFDRLPVNLIGPGEAVQVDGARVTAGFFHVLGAEAALGRAFAAGDDTPSAAPVVVLSHAFWMRHLGGRSDVLGRRISVNSRHHAIVGVMPADFAFPDSQVQVFLPLRVSPLDGRSYSAIARLRSDTTLTVARADIAAIAAGLSREHPESNANWSATVVPLHEQIVGDVRRPLLILFSAVGFLLVIACANAANLTSMRAAARAREMEIRLALGAGRARIVQQIVIESLAVAALGAVLGLALAGSAILALTRLAPQMAPLPRLHELSLDVWGVAFAAFAAIGAALLFGVLPALRSRRNGAAAALGAPGRAATPARRDLQAAMVIAQVALALPLLVGAGLMIRSYARLIHVDPGFRAENVLTVRMLLLPVRERAAHAEFVNEVLDRIRAVRGVRAAGSIARLPLDGGNMGSWYYRADRPEPAAGERPGGDISIVTPDYFRAMGIPLRKGRDFDARDRIGLPHVAILNETAARAFFGDEDPIGKRLTVSWNDARDVEIVGIAGDIRHGALQARPTPCLFLPNAQQPFPTAALVIRTAGEPAALATAIKAEIQRVDPDQGVRDIRTLHEIVGDATVESKAQTLLFAVFAVVALALASIGIYGVLAYSVAQRTREIGVRVALGASPGAAFRLVLAGGVRLTGAGMAIGVIAAALLTRFMQGMLFEIAPLDPVAFASVLALLSIVAAAACAIPAARASWIDPAAVLRQD